MNRFTIRQLLYILIAFGIANAVVYSLGSYYYLKRSAVKALQMESLNRAYDVTKQMNAIYDRVAYEYRKREIEMYQALIQTQAYFKTNISMSLKTPP
jgi:hypothetical protein